MRISLDHFIYCIALYKCKTIYSICGSIFSIICTVLGNVSKRSLITLDVGLLGIAALNDSTGLRLFVHRVDSTGEIQEPKGQKVPILYGRPLT